MKIYMGAKTVTSSSAEHQDVQEEDQEEQRGSLSLLPMDILSLIQLYLFTGDRLAFNAVCRATKSIQAPPLTLQLATHCPFSSSPSLILPRRMGSINACEVFHSAYNSFYDMEIPEFKDDAEIHCSKYGWLLMSSDNQTNLFFFNPFREMNKKIEIPYGGSSPAFYIIALSFPSSPTRWNWSVFGIFHSDEQPNFLKVGRIKSGEEQWTYSSFLNAYDFRVSNGTLVWNNDQYYYLDVKGRVAIFDPEHGKCKLMLCLGFGDSNSRLVDQSFLAAEDGVDGEILAVIVSHTHDASKVSVYKLSPSGTRWIPVKNLRDKMLFVSEIASFAGRATEQGMGNKIYFPKFHGKNGVFYSLTTKKYHSYDGGFSSKEPYGLEEMPTATWIQPSMY